jgi:hypothetical protein
MTDEPRDPFEYTGPIHELPEGLSFEGDPVPIYSQAPPMSLERYLTLMGMEPDQAKAEAEAARQRHAAGEPPCHPIGGVSLIEMLQWVRRPEDEGNPT